VAIPQSALPYACTDLARTHWKIVAEVLKSHSTSYSGNYANATATSVHEAVAAAFIERGFRRIQQSFDRPAISYRRARIHAIRFNAQICGEPFVVQTNGTHLAIPASICWCCRRPGPTGSIAVHDTPSVKFTVQGWREEHVSVPGCPSKHNNVVGFNDWRSDLAVRRRSDRDQPQARQSASKLKTV